MVCVCVVFGYSSIFTFFATNPAGIYTGLQIEIETGIFHEDVYYVRKLYIRITCG